tara:strand:- start:80 stop:334 length:255 start_codon:yes stop_codon:yes gene_type:complete
MSHKSSQKIWTARLDKLRAKGDRDIREIIRVIDQVLGKVIKGQCLPGVICTSILLEVIDAFLPVSAAVAIVHTKHVVHVVHVVH